MTSHESMNYLTRAYVEDVTTPWKDPFFFYQV
jgi:hypothetical protein